VLTFVARLSQGKGVGIPNSSGLGSSGPEHLAAPSSGRSVRKACVGGLRGPPVTNAVLESEPRSSTQTRGRLPVRICSSIQLPRIQQRVVAHLMLFKQSQL
jgi:hypothetical protein